MIRPPWPNLLLAALLLAALLAAASASAQQPSVSSMTLRQETGQSVPLAALSKGEHPLLLVFVASTCPVTQLYWERLKGTWRNCRDAGIPMALVGGNTDDSPASLREAMKGIEFDAPLLWDENHAVARALGVEFTPEAAILGPRGEVLYRGRIDDGWRDSTRVQRRDLDEALSAVLKDQKPNDCVDAPFMGSRLR